MLSDVPAALLVGGGEGMGSIEQTVHAVGKSIGADAQVICIFFEINIFAFIEYS